MKKTSKPTEATKPEPARDADLDKVQGGAAAAPSTKSTSWVDPDPQPRAPKK